MSVSDAWAERMEPPNERRIAVRLTPDALRRVRGGHPWVFDRSIVHQSREGAPGDLAVVFDDRRRFVAIGLYDPASPIRVRVLHAGPPTMIGGAFWRSKLAAAHERRHGLEPETTGYRLVNGENDGLGGLVVDRYAAVLVVKVYSSAWLAHLPAIIDALTELPGVDAVVLRLARNVASAETFGLSDGRVLRGEVADPVLFVEHGLGFEAATRTGQKTGHFLDQRDNRRRVGGLASGRRVLDVFSCTGGFAVHAAAGGARSVHLVDSNPHALEAARRNLALNRGQASDCEIETTAGDAFEVLAGQGTERRRYGLIVVDPPSFAQRSTQVTGALRAYRRLTESAVRLVEPGGTLVQSSCSSRVGTDAFVDGVLAAAERAGRRLQVIEVTGHAVDHPVTFPEGAYLKAVFATVL